MITTFFETDWKLWGNETSSYSQCPWDDLEAGHYEFPFALKFPNVNYPPSAEEPHGFTIRYVWCAQADGPALKTGLKSREYITPYRPIMLSTADKEWVYRETLMKDKKHALVEVQTKLYKQSYCPDEPFEMQLRLTALQADAKIHGIEYVFRKHHEGKMLVQQGTAFREYIRAVIHGRVPITSNANDNQISETVRFGVPTRMVSPSFTTRHTRVHYDLQFIINIEHGHHIFRMSSPVDFTIPIIIANLPHDNLLRIPGLTSIEDYRDSKECPIFFDPSMEEPPATPPATFSVTSPPVNEEPPNYFSLQEQPPQLELRKERKERTVFLTRPAKGAFHGHEILPATLIPGLFDEDW
ncbi:hypothetical protein BX666DRAFT_2019552 [Dichotomocladium elegans]|nr:hypothetical protein BX666DRAFT_2019552 [Dichotomocladium elegans]